MPAPHNDGEKNTKFSVTIRFAFGNECGADASSKVRACIGMVRSPKATLSYANCASLVICNIHGSISKYEVPWLAGLHVQHLWGALWRKQSPKISRKNDAHRNGMYRTRPGRQTSQLKITCRGTQSRSAGFRSTSDQHDTSQIPLHTLERVRSERDNHRPASAAP